LSDLFAKYLVDTNFFLTPYKAYYPMDIVPGFWKKVKELAKRGIIISIDKSLNELTGKDNNKKIDDALTSWCCENLPKNFFKESDEAIKEYSEIIKWSESQHYKRSAIDEFARYSNADAYDSNADAYDSNADAYDSNADAFIVAYAKKYNLTVITEEKSHPESKARIFIPDVCIAFDVKVMNIIAMFRELRESF
jgi:hypothetical protein